MWKVVCIFCVEDFDAFSYDLYVVTAVKIPRAVPSLSEINPTGCGLREARAIAKRKAHPSSAPELEVEVRPVEGMELISTTTRWLWGGGDVGGTEH